jgi:SAM-dependent methyltransferase
MTSGAPEKAGLVCQACDECNAGQDAGSSRHLGKVNGYRLFKCSTCGLVFVYPKPLIPELAELYDGYHESTGQEQLSLVGERDLFESVLQRIAEKAGKGELLDIGSSYGHFLSRARDEGFPTMGLEIARKPREYAQGILQLDVECKDIVEAQFEENRFSAITLLNVLEHLPEPYAVLREAWRIARDGGVAVVVVPSRTFAFPFFAVTRRLGLQLPVPTSAFDIPYHLSLFSPVSLRNLLSSAGWKDIEIANAPVIRNRSIAKTVAKSLVKRAGDLLQYATGGRLIFGYSLLAIASKRDSL